MTLNAAKSCNNNYIPQPSILKRKEHPSSLTRLTDFFAKFLSIQNTTDPFPRETCGGIHRNWGKGLVSKELAIQKMEKNLAKAKIEHGYGGPERLSPINPKPLQCETGHAEAQGPRPSMEDAHFSIPLENGTLVGVLDGHGGIAVANFASMKFQALFPQILQKNEGNVHQTLEEVFLIIQEEIIKNTQFNQVGSTAVICYIEKSTNRIYTATLGDSEANIYRIIDGHCISIPLSCVRDWTSKRDEKRAAKATEGEYKMPILQFWQVYGLHPKERRVNEKTASWLSDNTFHGVNVSRAFGDQSNNIGRAFNAVVAKPKITILSLEPGDILVLACDGLKDYVEESAIVSCIEKSVAATPDEISKILINLALSHSTEDNVTALTVKIKA